MTTRTVALAVTAALVLALLGILSAAMMPARAAASVRCLEDEPCYRWDTMGNHRRGVFVIGRRARIVVSTCGYARVHARIDWTRTTHVRGDYYALHACKGNDV
jgi:hypothetical protein